jgi:acetylornithine deacetylase
MDVVRLTKKLVEIPSPSGKEKRIGKFLVNLLKKNFKVTTQNVNGRFNVLATVGQPKLILTAHMDTVPKELKIHEDDKYLYGRGTCDTKGNVAGMICAGEEAIKLKLNNFGILIDVDEETDFSGIKKALDLVEPEIVVVGEPTNLKIAFGQKGLIGIKVRCKGVPAHASTPENGVSAIDKLIDLLQRVKEADLPVDPLLGKTTINIGMISGGVATNVVAASATADLDIRTTRSNKETLAILSRIIGRSNMEVTYSFEHTVTDSGFIKKLRAERIVAPYFTEMFFWAKKSKTLIFGAGDFKLAHSDNEKVRKLDLEKGKEMYLQMIKEFT